jgi:aminomethyltransferase
MSPVLNKGIGMGYISEANAKLNTEIYIRVRNKNLKAKVVKLPFIQK